MIGWWALASALAGELDGEIALDALHAASTSDQPASGPQESLSATELGVRIRGTVEQGRITGALDYQGREPLGGLYPTLPFRLLYRAEVVFAAVPDRWDVGAGRFLADSVIFLPVDGVRTTIRPSERSWVAAFGGRRGISTARQNLGFEDLLPAVGASGGVRTDPVDADALLVYAGDQILLGTPADRYSQWVNALNGRVRATVRPVRTLSITGAVTAAQRANYVLGPVGEDPLVEVTALDLFQGVALTSWRPSDVVRVDYDLIHQRAELFRGGVDATPPGDVPLVDPTFTDNRARVHLRLLDAAWLRPDLRLRLRPDRTELRYGVAADWDRMPIAGPFLRARAQVDDILRDDSANNDVGATDRLLWSASGGWSDGPLELEAGASFIDRAAGPVSGRVSAAGLPTASDDLSPFVLEAQNIGFLRGFYASHRWFAGLDLEVNTLDAEVRGLLQVGLLGDASW